MKFETVEYETIRIKLLLIFISLYSLFLNIYRKQLNMEL